MKSSAVVLLSGGLDSGFNLFKASHHLAIKLVLTFDYGQKAAKREVETARRLCKKLNLPHRVLELPWFSLFTRTSLVAEAQPPRGLDVEIDNVERSHQTAKNVWVPNRNGIFLNIAAGFAEGLGCEFVIPGFNLEEAQTFPDNSGDFLKTLDHAWEFSTATKVKTHCYSLGLNKTEIVSESLKLGLPIKDLWPCYLSGARWCGSCESCLRFARALKMNSLDFDSINAEA